MARVISAMEPPCVNFEIFVGMRWLKAFSTWSAAIALCMFL